MKRKLVIIVLLASICMFIGCASVQTSSEESGSSIAETRQFNPDSNIPQGKALVYIYRVSRFAGSAVKVLILSKDGPVVSLADGTYYKHIENPGTIKYWPQTETNNDPLTLEIKEGEVYYVRFAIAGIATPFLTMATKEKAQKEMVNLTEKK